MAKSAVAVKKHEHILPSEIDDDFMRADAGRGTSQAAEDNIVPLIYILQANSPQAKKGPDRIEGAEAGDFWLRNDAHPIVKGEEGLIFQPCAFSKGVVEWQPNRGGFVAHHERMPADAVQRPSTTNPNKLVWVNEDGNELVETRYHAGLVHRPGLAPVPYVLPLSSTNHAASRQWMVMMNGKTFEDGSKKPSFGFLYKLTTRHRTNAYGEWFGLAVEDYEKIKSREDYERGKALADAYEAGAKVADRQDAATSSSEEDEVPF